MELFVFYSRDDTLVCHGPPVHYKLQLCDEPFSLYRFYLPLSRVHVLPSLQCFRYVLLICLFSVNCSFSVMLVTLPPSNSLSLSKQNFFCLLVRYSQQMDISGCKVSLPSQAHFYKPLIPSFCHGNTGISLLPAVDHLSLHD